MHVKNTVIQYFKDCLVVNGSLYFVLLQKSKLGQGMVSFENEDNVNKVFQK